MVEERYNPTRTSDGFNKNNGWLLGPDYTPEDTIGDQTVGEYAGGWNQEHIDSDYVPTFGEGLGQTTDAVVYKSFGLNVKGLK